MPHPSELGLEQLGINAGRVSMVQDLQVGDAILPAYSQNGSEGSHVGILQLLDVSAIQRP